jgi:hypothetical protein
MDRLCAVIKEGVPLEKITSYLDSLSHADCLQEVSAVGASLQKKLFSMAQNNIKSEDLIAAEAAPLEPVIFYGKNSLPILSRFQKRMCRSRHGKTIIGYNHQALRPLTGPGYFVIGDDSDRPGEVMIDYTKVPSEIPEQWPAYQDNEKGISRLIYGGMKDYLRRVSRDIFIGEATKGGRSMNQYFILCRSAEPLPR